MANRTDELLRESRTLPHGLLRVELVQEAVREADVRRDERRSFDARWELVEAATRARLGHMALVAFTWCLGYVDRLGDRFDRVWELLLRFLWITESLVRFPEVSLRQITETEEELARRFEQFGYGPRPVLKIRWSNALYTGRHDLVPPLVEAWAAAPRDALAECEACEQDALVHMHLELGDGAAALAAAEPILDGTSKCESVPGGTFAGLLQPLAERRRYDEAEAFLTSAYRFASKRRDYLASIARCLLYLVHRNELDRAAAILEEHLPLSLEDVTPSGCDFDTAGMLLLRRLLELPDTRRPTWSSRSPGGGPTTTEELLEFLSERVERTVRVFDQRNGNTWFADSVAEMERFATGG